MKKHMHMITVFMVMLILYTIFALYVTLGSF